MMNFKAKRDFYEGNNSFIRQTATVNTGTSNRGITIETFENTKDLLVLHEGNNSFISQTTTANTGTSNRSITIEALENTKDLLVLHEGRGILLESDDSSTCQRSPSLRITPTIVSANNNTLLYGVFIEPENGRDTYDHSSPQVRFDPKTVPLDLDEYEFVEISDSGNTIVMTVESNERNEYLKSKHLNNPTSTVKRDPVTSDQVEVFASIGGTIEKKGKTTVIPAPKKINGCIYAGAFDLKTDKINSTLKFYIDKDLHIVVEQLLKDERVRNVSLELRP